jgi:hypothetical protein
VITLNLDFDCGFEVTNQQKFSGYLFSKFCGLLAQTYDVKDNEDICLKFTIFYMLVDHSIDNNNASNNNVVDNERTYKKVSGNLLLCLKKLFKILMTLKNFEFRDNTSIDEFDTIFEEYGIVDNIKFNIKRAILIYCSIVKTDIQRYYMKLAFEAEIEASEKQYDNEVERDKLLSYCYRKGETTVYAVASLLKIEVTKDLKYLGRCVQLADDLVDIDDDIKSGIITYATINVKDTTDLIILFYHYLSKMSNFCIGFKFALLHVLFYCIANTNNELKYKVDNLWLNDRKLEFMFNFT